MNDLAAIILDWSKQADQSGGTVFTGLASSAWRAIGADEDDLDDDLRKAAGALAGTGAQKSPSTRAEEILDRLRSAEALAGGPAPARLRLLHLPPTGKTLTPPAPVFWLAIDGTAGQRQLPTAILQLYRDALVKHEAEAGAARPYAGCVLIASVTGPDRARPDIVVVGPAHTRGQAQGEGSCIRTFAFSRMQGRDPNYINAQVGQLVTGLKSAKGLAEFLNADKAGDARDVVRNQLKGSLERLMALLDALPGKRAESEAELHALRESATVLVFRVMFLAEIEARGLLWRAGSMRRTLADAADAALDAVARPGEDEREDDAAGVFLAMCRALREGGDADVVVQGGSLFLTRPNPQFDDLVVERLGRVDRAALAVDSKARREWRDALAKTYEITQGVVANKASQHAEGALLGLGGPEHVHRVLGDVYEQILALQPVRDGGHIRLSAGEGKDERKALGAHYTPEGLVEEVVRPALGALFHHHWAETKGDAKAYTARIAGLRVLDPAMGSAHFLTVAAREIATELEWTARFGHARHVDNADVHERVLVEDPMLANPAASAIRAGVARRLRDVVQRCCHGVDVSPLAVELGKLSLWLFTMTTQTERLGHSEVQRPTLAFLDANVQCGDSLIGLAWVEVGAILKERFDGLAERPDGGERQLGLLGLKGELVADKIKTVAGLLTDLHGGDAALKGDPYRARAALSEKVRGQLAEVRWAFDLAVLGSFFGVGKSQASRKGLEDALIPYLAGGAPKEGVNWRGVLTAPLGEGGAVGDVRAAVVRLARQGALIHGRAMRAFHWELAFPDVFATGVGGFDAIVANPPFVGDRDLGGRIGARAVEYLRGAFTRRKGRPGGTLDLSAFFLLRYDDVLGEYSSAGTLASNTVVQAKNRTNGLGVLIEQEQAFRMLRGDPSRDWPGDAAVFVSLLHVVRAGLRGQRPPAGVRTEGSGLALVRPAAAQGAVMGSDATFGAPSAGVQQNPGVAGFRDLPARQESLFLTGMFLRGNDGAPDDFVHDMSEAGNFDHRILRAYVTNQEVQQSVPVRPYRVAIDVYDELQRAELGEASPVAQLNYLRANFPAEIKAIDGVRRARLELDDTNPNRPHRERWWIFGSPRVELRERMALHDRFIAVGRPCKNWVPAPLSSVDSTSGLPLCPMDNLYLAADPTGDRYAVLCSFAFESAARALSSSFEIRLRFSPTETLAFYAFPWASTWDDGPCTEHEASTALVSASESLLTLRARLLADDATLAPLLSHADVSSTSAWGATALYNLYDAPAIGHPDIRALRTEHRLLLDTVLAAYAADSSLPNAAPLFVALRFAMADDAPGDHPDGLNGWAFERPWIDGHDRYVPAERHRNALWAALLQANEDRYWQELTLYLDAIDEIASSLPGVAAQLLGGLTPKQLAKLLARENVKLKPEDALPLLHEGRRQKRWVGVGDGEDTVFTWVERGGSQIRAVAEQVRADRDAAERERAAAAEQRATTDAARRQREAEKQKMEADRLAAARRAEELAKVGRPVAPKPVQRPLLAAEAPLRPALQLDPIVYVRFAQAPLAKAQILAETLTPEEDWNRVRRELDEEPDIIRLGEKRGTRYIAWPKLLDLIASAIGVADKGDGATKGEAVAAFEAAHCALDDAAWTRAVGELVAAKRIVKSGAGRGTRYRVRA